MATSAPAPAVAPGVPPGPAPPGASGPAPALWTAAGLLALTLLLYHAVAFGPGVPGGYDTQTYFFAYRQAVAAALRAGHFPLWDAHLFLGAPLFANVQAAVLYPPNLLYLVWPTPQAIAASLVLHVWWTCWGMALLCRRTFAIPWPAALVGGALFGLGGFFSAQAGHVNQVDAAAWLPWLLLCLDLAWQRRSALLTVLGAVIVAVQFLAGHTQESYFILATTVAWGAWRLWQKRRARHTTLVILGTGAVALIGGIALAAAQLAPTLELAGQSIRRSGLTMAEASSFSLRPGQLAIELLPGYAHQPDSSEHIAYVGAMGLVLAMIGAVGAARRPGVRLLYLLTAVPLALAFGIYDPLWQAAFHLVPGFSSFRVPARWLYVTSFGLAALGALGAARLWDQRPRRIPVPLLLLAAAAALVALTGAAALALGREPGGAPPAALLTALGFGAALPLAASERLGRLVRPLLLTATVLELVVAASWLELNQPVPPQVYSDQRQTVSFLRGYPEYGRALSIAEDRFDPGDAATLAAIAGRTTGPASTYRTSVDVKFQDILTPNLALAYGVWSVDGYDGGILPLADYVALKQVFLPPCALCANPDAILREELTAPLPLPWLRLLGVGALIDDRLHDFHQDGVAYDTTNDVQVAPSASATFSNFEPTPATLVGILTDVQGAQPVPGTPVATVTILDTAGRATDAVLVAGENTAALEGPASVQPAAGLREPPDGHAFLATIPLPERPWLRAVSVRSMLPSGQVEVRALSLVDSLTGSDDSVTLSPDNSVTRVLRGDVDLYRIDGGGDPAFVATSLRQAADDGAAAALLRSAAFPLDHAVVLSYPDLPPRASFAARALRRAAALLQGDPRTLPSPPPASATSGTVRVNQRGTRLTATVSVDGAAYLVLKQTWYPGWWATVDGRRAPIYRADLALQAIPVPAGSHTIVVDYRPGSLLIGGAVSALATLALLLIALLVPRLSRRAVSLA